MAKFYEFLLAADRAREYCTKTPTALLRAKYSSARKILD
jgi:hypothetical protein